MGILRKTPVPVVIMLSVLIGLSALLYRNYSSSLLGQNIKVNSSSYEIMLENEVTVTHGIGTTQLEVPSSVSAVGVLPGGFEFLDGGISVSEQVLPGQYSLQYFIPGKIGATIIHHLEVKVLVDRLDLSSLQKELQELTGVASGMIGIYIHDFGRDQQINLNGGIEYWPGSVAKLPVVILALRDIDSGKLLPSDTFPVQDLYRFSYSDNVGGLPDGAPVSIQTLIDETIHLSNNSAMYHLRAALGGVEEVLDRTKSELGVGSFNDLPHHVAKPQEIGKVLADLYYGKTLSTDSQSMLLNLMKNSVPSLRDGIPSQLPSSTEVANKVGFLFGKGKDAYNDAAIIYGIKTDYALVIMTNGYEYDAGREQVRKISKLVHSYLEN